MNIRIDINDPVPQFEQLVNQIKSAVQSGQLIPGDPLWSIRQLSRDLELNSKTIAKAYKLLERDKVIESRGYRGTYVHAEAKTNCSKNLQAWSQSVLKVVIEELRKNKLTDSEIRNAFSSCMQNQK